MLQHLKWSYTLPQTPKHESHSRAIPTRHLQHKTSTQKNALSTRAVCQADPDYHSVPWTARFPVLLVWMGLWGTGQVGTSVLSHRDHEDTPHTLKELSEHDNRNKRHYNRSQTWQAGLRCSAGLRAPQSKSCIMILYPNLINCIKICTKYKYTFGASRNLLENQLREKSRLAGTTFPDRQESSNGLGAYLRTRRLEPDSPRRDRVVL